MLHASRRSKRTAQAVAQSDVAQIAELVSTAADLIGRYDRALAALFRNSPFQRVNAANAFAAGFRRKGATATSAPQVVLRVALLDQTIRARGVGR